MIGTKIDKKSESFEEEYAKAAEYCNESQKAVIEDKGDYFEVVAWEPPDDSRDRALSFLSKTDNYALRLATGEAKESDWSEAWNCSFAEIMRKRAEARETVNKEDSGNGDQQD